MSVDLWFTGLVNNISIKVDQETMLCFALLAFMVAMAAVVLNSKFFNTPRE